MLGCLLTTVSLSWGGDQSLGHYAILKADQQTAEVLQNRFKARGEPLFMVRDPQVGVSPGDIIRFANKVVLVDAAVMQTLATEGILRHLGQSTVLRLRAKSQSSIWNTRSSLVENAREQKAYHLGANMLKVFEDYFGKSPATGEMALHFTGSDLELVVPDAFLDRLSFNNVRRVHPSGSPLLVSDPPHLPLFQGETFQWRAWGADPASAEADLQYGPLGTAPPGLLWNDSLHAWVGKLDRVGNYSLGAWVRNSNGFADSLRFSLNVRTDVPPHLLNRPLQGLHPGDSIQGALAIEDPDHALIDLRCSSSDGPAWFLVDSLCEFHAKPPLNWNGRDSVRLRVQDPLGAADSTTLPLGEVPEFSSLLHAIRFLVPRDTLVLGREYGWEAQTLLTPGIHLLGVEGMTGATWNGRRLRIQPWTEGKNNLRFRLATSADTVVLSQTLFVKPNQPPRFQSSLSAVLVREGTSLHYRPVAIDPEGDPVAYEARYSDGGDIRVVQGELDLWTRSPGVYAMEVLAGDGVNSPTQQYVSWTVENDRREWLGGGLRMITVGGDQYWWLFARRGAARFGLFTPRLGDVMRAEPNTTKEWPFFFAGASLLGERGLARG
ncbi:MAG TPA: hypothetical protein VLM37_12970, partial [Fibrobacteraceae bacterium]|nr:hypothetical protein [Fibrobacteraceae bacterium]